MKRIWILLFAIMLVFPACSSSKKVRTQKQGLMLLDNTEQNRNKKQYKPTKQTKKRKKTLKKKKK